MNAFLYPFVLMVAILSGLIPASASNKNYCFSDGNSIVTEEMLTAENSDDFAPTARILPGTEEFDAMMAYTELYAGPKSDDLDIAYMILYRGTTPKTAGIYFLAIFQDDCLVTFFQTNLKDI